MSKDKSFALYATLKQPIENATEYRPFIRASDGRSYCIWVRAEIHDCHYAEAMDKVTLRDNENFLNTQPAE